METPNNLSSPTQTMEAPSGQPASGPGEPIGKPRKTGKLVVIIVLIIAILGGAGYGVYAYMAAQNKPKTTTTTERVKVGVLLALSGGSSSMGYGSLKGIQLAKKQLGADNIELVQADGKCDPKTAPEAMQYLISQGVQVVIGENCSSASKAVVDLANQHKVLLLSPSASSPTLSIADDYFFRTVPSDEGQGAFIAQSMYNAGFRKVAVFYTNEPYGAAINEVFKKKFEGLGGKVAVAVNAESSVIDVTNQVKAIKAAKPDAIALLTNSTVSSTAVMKVARETGVTVPFYGGDNLYDNTIITNNGAAAEGLHVVSFPTGSKSFKQALLNEYHVTEQLYAAPEAYDAFKAIQMAIQKGAVTGEDFRRVISTLKFEGASGPIEFDKYGEVPYPDYKYDLLKVQDGAFTIVNQ